MRRTAILISITALAAVTVFGAPTQSPGRSRASGGTPDCTINGIVRNNRGQGVSDALVKILARRGSHGASQVRTKADGTFSLQRNAGTLHVIAQHRGEGRAVINTRATVNQILTLELSLQKGHHRGWAGHSHFHLGTHRAKK
jgi:hypothetical protein